MASVIPEIIGAMKGLSARRLDDSLDCAASSKLSITWSNCFMVFAVLK